MPRTYVRKTNRGSYSHELMQEAVRKVRSGVYSSLHAATQYNVPRSTLMDRVSGRHGLKSRTLGKPKAIPQHVEKKLAGIIGFMQLRGFYSSKKELAELIGDYLIENRVDVFRSGKPGVDWVKSFLERHNLESRVMKRKEHILNQHFCVLKDTIDNFGLSKTPEKIWNINEACFTIDKDGCVSKHNSDSETNATVVTAINAVGEKAPLLIVLKKNKRMSNDNICHASTATGRLDREVFINYITDTFLEKIPAPFLIIYGGKATNIDIKLIEDAKEMDVIFLRSPLFHGDVTDDLKGKWDRNLRAIKDENEFVAIIDRDYKEFETDNIRLGFRNMGIHPLDGGVCGIDFSKMFKRFKDDKCIYTPYEEEDIDNEISTDHTNGKISESDVNKEVDDVEDSEISRDDTNDKNISKFEFVETMKERDEDREISRDDTNDNIPEFVVTKKEIEDVEDSEINRDDTNEIIPEFVVTKKEVEDVEDSEVSRGYTGDGNDKIPEFVVTNKEVVNEQLQPLGVNDDWEFKDDDISSGADSSRNIQDSFYSGASDTMPTSGTSTQTGVSKPKPAPAQRAASSNARLNRNQCTDQSFGPSYGGIIDAARTVRTPSKVCCVFGCRNTELEHLDKDFYPFPADQKLRRQWLELINRLDLEDKIKAKESRVCSDHFDRNDHTNGALNPDAVPHLELPRKKVAFIYAPDPNASGFLPVNSEVKTEAVDPDVTAVEIQFEAEEAPKITFNEPTPRPRPPPAVPPIRAMPPSSSYGVRTMVVEPIPQSTKTQMKSFSVIKMEHNDGPQPMQVEYNSPREAFFKNASISAIEQINIPPPEGPVGYCSVHVQTTKALVDQMNLPMKRKYEGEIKEANKKVKQLEHKLLDPKMNKKKFLECCDVFLDLKIANIVKSHVSLLDRYVGNRYSNSFKTFALNLYLCSPQSYKFVKQFFYLPSTKTILRFQMPITTGVNSNLIDSFKVKVGEMSDKDKISTLCFDYIGVNKNLYYDVTNDYLCGIQDIDHVLGSEPAQYAILLMVRGLYSKWKQPISFALVTEKTCYPTLKHWILKITTVLIDMGLNLKAFVTNMDTEFLDLSDVSATEPYFEVNERKIYHVFDVPYLFKSARDDFMKYDFHFGSKVAKWSHILKVYETDKEEELSLMPKITNDHVRPKGEAKDNPKIAVEVFSRAVAAVMNFHVKTNLAPKKTKDTAEFITKMSRLYDVLTSQRTLTSNEFKQPYRGTPEQEQCLTETLEYLQTVEMKDKEGNPVEKRLNFVTGLIVTIKSIMALSEDLRKENVKYILTKNLSKDCMDAYFAKVRQNGGNNCARPTSIMFTRAFRRMFLNNLVSNTKDGGTEMDLKQTLIKISEYVKSDAIKDEPEQSVRLNVGVTDYQMLPSWPIPSLTFISGYLLWKCLERHHCQISLDYFGRYYDLEPAIKAEGIKVLIERFKEYKGCNVNKEGLLEPPQTLVAFVEKMEDTFSDYYRGVNIEAQNFGWNLYKIMEEDTFEMPCPCFALQYLKFLFIRTKIYHTVKDYNRKNRPIRRRR